jgi:hypothetical protein
MILNLHIKLHKLISKIALFAILFASFAPSITGFMTLQKGFGGFKQSVCSSLGNYTLSYKPIFVNVKVSALALNTKGQQESPSNNQLHVNHCWFCSKLHSNCAIETTAITFIGMLVKPIHAVAWTKKSDLPHNSVCIPPAQGPP